MSVETFTTAVPESVFTVTQRGDILRRVRSLHPRQDALKNLADAEAAADTSGLLLENAYRHHQRNLERVDQARQQFLLTEMEHPEVCPTPVPFVPAGISLDKKPTPAPADDLRVIKSHPDQPDLLEGLARITRVTPVSDSKTSGMLALACGRTVRWTCASSYVDALAPLFAQVPVVVRGFFTDKDHFCLTLVRAASREEWDVDDAGNDELMLLGQDAVTEAARIRKNLIRLYGPACQDCGSAVTKSSAAAFRDGDRTDLLCHPCKAIRTEAA
jgi:hypothetical protein